MFSLRAFLCSTALTELTFPTDKNDDVVVDASDSLLLVCAHCLFPDLSSGQISCHSEIMTQLKQMSPG